ncbi:putative ribonuclease H-like domain-containing protein, partial [Tanacetum coccineum]
MNSPEFNLISHLEYQFEEEETKAMVETMEEYMCKTRGDYGSGVTRPKIDAKYNFELKGQFLKELRDNTFSGSDHEDANEHIEKVIKIVNLFHIPNITQDQIMLRDFLMSLIGAASRWLRNKPSSSIITWEGLKTKFLNKYCPSTQTVKKMEEINNFQQEPNEILYQAWERFKELLTKCPQHYLTDMQENSKLIFVPRQATIPFPSHLYDDCYDEENGLYRLKDLDAYSIGTTLRNDTLPRKEKEPGSFTLPCYINNVCFRKALANLGASVSVMPLSTRLNLGLGELAHTKLTVELANRTMKHPKGIAKNVLVGIGTFVFPIDYIILDMPEDVNVPLILGRLFLSTAHAKVDVFKRKITLRVGDEKIIFKSVKPASSLMKRVYMLSLREKMDLDLESKLMGETLILNRSLDPLYENYIELNNLNKPLELRRNRVDNLEPIVEEGEVVNEPMMDIVKTRYNFIGGLDDYPSNCDFDRRIHIDYAYNLKFSCMMVVEDMDPYLDERMGDMIVGEPFCKASCVEARRFDGIITIRHGDDSVTYQMVQSNPRFKHLTNEKCKIPPLLK